MDIEDVAEVAHEVNRAYCQSLRDDSQMRWDEAPEWQRESCRNGVRFHLMNADMTPEQSHENWLKQKVAEGWVWGPQKDVEKKQHPCVCTYEQLPSEQKAKDFLFRAIVRSLTRHVNF